MSIPMQNERYTYADYCTWDDNERWELIEGIPYAMSPAPSWIHQRVSSRLHGVLFNFLSGKPCEVFHAPFDVRLNADDEDDTVVQPDLVVICDNSKLGGTGCTGTPDMVVEILSPSTARHDRMVKFRLYQQYSVKEYWIVDPDTKIVQACLLSGGLYVVNMYGDTDSAPVHVLPGCEISLKDVFEL